MGNYNNDYYNSTYNHQQFSENLQINEDQNYQTESFQQHQISNQTQIYQNQTINSMQQQEQYNDLYHNQYKVQPEPDENSLFMKSKQTSRKRVNENSNPNPLTKFQKLCDKSRKMNGKNNISIEERRFEKFQSGNYKIDKNP